MDWFKNDIIHKQYIDSSNWNYKLQQQYREFYL